MSTESTRGKSYDVRVRPSAVACRRQQPNIGRPRPGQRRSDARVTRRINVLHLRRRVRCRFGSRQGGEGSGAGHERRCGRRCVP